MRVDLSYGRSGLTIDFDDDLQLDVLRKQPMPVLDDPDAAVRDALAGPIGSPSLSELAANASSACLLICDITRPVPNGVFLRPIIETMLAAGMNATAITVLVATGLHRPNDGVELAGLVGDPWVLDTVEVVNHFARDDDDHVDLGTTASRGIAVKLDRRFVNADLKIATGLVEPHFMAGYSGGRKVIAPGIAHQDTIRSFHSSRFMSDPAATSCTLDGNPLHEAQLEIVGMLGGALALNTVIDEERRLAFVNFGEIVESHHEAVAVAGAYSRVPVERRYSTIVTTAGGHPLDSTYYQTVKGITSPLEILADGGDLIIASACAEGLGSAEFVDSQRRLVDLGPRAFLDSISEKQFAEIDEWQTQMLLRAPGSATVHLFADGLDEASMRLTGVEVASSVMDAVRRSVRRSGDPRVAVIPEGPYVVPFLESALAGV